MIVSINKLKLFCWFVVIVILVSQMFLSKYSALSNVALLILSFFSFLSYSNAEKKYFVIIVFSLLFLLGFSFVQGNTVSYAIRFSLVIFFVLMAYFIKIDSAVCLKILFLITLLWCFAILIAEFYMLSLDKASARAIRSFVLQSQVGDIYPYGFIYKIQLKGFAIIPFVYMLSYAFNLFPESYKSYYRILYFSATVFAGNFAYLLAIFFFHFILYWYDIRNQQDLLKRVIFALLLLFVFAGSAVTFVSNTLEEKQEVSSAIRIDQTKVLFDDLCVSPFTMILGRGLGNTIDLVTRYRDYRDNIYFELQILYILNQLGVFPFFLFLVVNIYFTMQYIPNKKLKLVYIGYLIYSSTNPYIIDTNHVVVIVSLISAQSLLSSKTRALWKE